MTKATREGVLSVFKKYAPNEYKEMMKADKGFMEDHLDFLASSWGTLENGEKRLKKAAEEGLID